MRKLKATLQKIVGRIKKHMGSSLMGVAAIFISAGFYTLIEVGDKTFGLIFTLIGAGCLPLSVWFTQKEIRDAKKKADDDYWDRLKFETRIIGVVGEHIISELKGLREDLRGGKNDDTKPDPT